MILEKLQEIMKHYADVKVTEAASLVEDLGLDSFMLVHFLTEVEECFDIDIPEEEFQYLVTVRDVMDEIQSAVKCGIESIE